MEKMETRVAKVAEYVRSYLYEMAEQRDGPHIDPDYRWQHTLRMVNIVSDADNIDRFSAYRTLLYCQPEMFDFTALVEKLTARLEVLWDYRGKRLMGTETSHHLFNQKLDGQIEFYEAILTQHAVSRLPDLAGM